MLTYKNFTRRHTMEAPGPKLNTITPELPLPLPLLKHELSSLEQPPANRTKRFGAVFKKAMASATMREPASCPPPTPVSGEKKIVFDRSRHAWVQVDKDGMNGKTIVMNRGGKRVYMQTSSERKFSAGKGSARLTPLFKGRKFKGRNLDLSDRAEVRVSTALARLQAAVMTVDADVTKAFQSHKKRGGVK